MIVSFSQKDVQDAYRDVDDVNLRSYANEMMYLVVTKTDGSILTIDNVEQLHAVHLHLIPAEKTDPILPDEGGQ